MVTSIDGQKVAIWHHWSNFCGVPLKKSNMPTSQGQFWILRATFVMSLPRYNPIHSKKCIRICSIEWSTVRPLEWNNIPFLMETIIRRKQQNKNFKHLNGPPFRKKQQTNQFDFFVCFKRLQNCKCLQLWPTFIVFAVGKLNRLTNWLTDWQSD